MSRIVAIVGRPNVRKSRLFNRLARKRISIVHDQPGVTRDVISAEVEDGAYTLLDTGGIGLKGGDSSSQIVAATEVQVQFAIDTSQVILLVVDAKDGVTALDERIANRLRRKDKSVILVVNKVDFNEARRDNPDYYRLGLGEPFFLSAEHGVGEADLRDAILARLGPAAEESAAAKDADKPLCVCFVGRPNVGKSSLVNRLLREERVLVSDMPGTTRDAIDVMLNWRRRRFRIVDTAGIRRAGKVAGGGAVEAVSVLQSRGTREATAKVVGLPLTGSVQVGSSPVNSAKNAA